MVDWNILTDVNTICDDAPIPIPPNLVMIIEYLGLG